jgi:hypothetical protein
LHPAGGGRDGGGDGGKDSGDSTEHRHTRNTPSVFLYAVFVFHCTNVPMKGKVKVTHPEGNVDVFWMVNARTLVTFKVIR